jgi:hypothetical protein
LLLILLAAPERYPRASGKAEATWPATGLLNQRRWNVLASSPFRFDALNTSALSRLETTSMSYLNVTWCRSTLAARWSAIASFHGQSLAFRGMPGPQVPSNPQMALRVASSPRFAASAPLFIGLHETPERPPLWTT